MTTYNIENYDRIFGYIWTLKGFETEPKFGDTFVNANENPLEECHNRIRESFIVRKDLFDDKSVTLHEIIDLTELAKAHNRLYKNSKMDNLVRQLGKNSLKSIKKNDVHFATVEELIRDINDVVHGNKKLKTYKAREEQITIENGVVNYFLSCVASLALNSGINKKIVNRVLINAKMRFGKCYVTYRIIKKLEFKKVLIITYKPSGVRESWMDDLDHIDFGNFEFIKASDLSQVKFNEGSDKVQIIFASTQDCIGVGDKDSDGNIIKEFKSKWDTLFNQRFDLLVKDEDHYGYDTDLSNNFLKNLSYTYEIALSGTPFKAILDGKYKPEQVFTWTYVQEQELKQKEIDNGLVTNVYQSLPTFEVIIPKYDKKLLKEFYNYYSKGEEVTNFKIFSNEKLTEEFLTWANMDPQIRNYLTNHMFWFLPRVENCNIVEKALKSHPYWKQYQIVNAGGTDGEKDIDKTKSLVYERHPKSITLSCGRWNTGSTVKEWTSTWMLDDGNSAENWFQTGFRPGTPWVDKDGNILKKSCYIVDFNQDRVLRSYVQYSAVIAKHTGNESSTYSRELMRTMPIYGLDGVNMVKLSPDLLTPKFEELYSSHLESSRIFNELALDDTLKSKLDHHKSVENLQKSFEQVQNQDSSPKGKNHQVTKLEDGKEGEIKENIDYKAIILDLTKNFGNFLYSVDIQKLEDINDSPEKFKTYTRGFTVDLFMDLIDSGVIDRQLLEESIEFSNLQKYNILN